MRSSSLTYLYRFRPRNSKIYILTALEDALSPAADPDKRISVAKFLYSSNLVQRGALVPLADAESLVDAVLNQVQNDLLMRLTEVSLQVVPDD